MLILKWSENDGPEQSIDFDCSVTEGYESAAEVSEHAVEKGANVADHVRPKNEQISLEAVISNTPIVAMVFGMDGATGSVQGTRLTVGGKSFSAQTFEFSQSFDRVARVDTELRRLKNAGQVMTVTTSVRTVSDCVIVRYRWDRNVESGHSLILNLDLSQIRIATTQRTDAIPRQRRGRQQSNHGAQPAVEDNRTFTRRAADSILAAFR